MPSRIRSNSRWDCMALAILPMSSSERGGIVVAGFSADGSPDMVVVWEDSEMTDGGLRIE